MKSISKSLFTLLNTSVKITYPFNEIALIKKNDLNTEYDFYSDISLVLFTKYKDKMLKIWGSSHTPPTPQSYSEEILINLETKPELLHKVYHSFDGKILFKINDNFIENSIRVLLEKKGDYDQELKDINNRTQIGVLYPFGEIVQKIHLNQVRGVNICESLSRIYDYLGYRVQRFSCIQNSAHFHGILLSYLLEKKVNEELDFNGEGIKFEDLSSFLIEKKLKTEREIMAFGGEILQEISINEKMIKVFDKLNQMALEDLMLNYNAFITNKEHLTILDTYNLNKRTGKLIKDLVKKGKVLYREDIGYYIKIKKGSRVLNIMDPYNLLTKEGVFLGFLYEISSLHFIDKVVFSTDLQDKSFYQNVEEGFGILFDERRMAIEMDFYGHNSLLLEKNVKSNPNVFLSTFLKDLIKLGIEKSLSVSPTFPPNLSQENSSNLQRMILGWIRYLDHRHPKEESYIMDIKQSLDFIYSNDIVNTRSFLNDTMKDFKETNLKTFKITTVEERVLAIKLLEFVDILEKTLEEKNLKVLTDYLEALCKMVRYYKNSQSNMYLIKAAFIIISKGFYLVGVI